MNKYLTLFQLNWQNGLVYRVSVFLWRFRQLLTTVMALTIWQVVFTNQDQVLGYAGSEMITYIFLVGILQSLIFATLLHGLANTIYSGNLSTELLKPVNIYVYLGMQDVADKIKNFVFILLETGILFALFKPEFVIPSWQIWPIFGLWILGGIILNFLISLLFGSIGFWSPETWGPRFLFFMIADFTAGRLYPLDILPDWVQRLVFFTPFPYFSFVQTQLFLQKMNTGEILQHTAILSIWIIGLAIMVKWIWGRGLKDYAAAGH